MPCSPHAPSPTDEDRRQEREVRLTAQRILTRHLHPGDNPRRTAPTYWPDTNLDLTAATLTNLDLSGCHLRNARFSQATFVGDAVFNEARFAGDAEFSRATFTRNTEFSLVRFAGNAWFYRARFAENARFYRATLAGNALFSEATFTGDVEFDAATFTGNAEFDKVTFARRAGFDAASFSAAPDWGDVRFEYVPTMRSARVRIDSQQGPDPVGRAWPAGWTNQDEPVPAGRRGRWTGLVPVPAILPPDPRRPSAGNSGAARPASR